MTLGIDLVLPARHMQVVGPIIEQDVVRVSHRDSEDEMIRKGRDLEKLAFLVPWVSTSEAACSSTGGRPA